MSRSNLLGIAACAAMLAAPLAAVAKTAGSENHHPAVSARTAWPPETLSGHIMQADPAQHLLIVTGPNGVPFDMVVRHSTVIESGGQKLTLNQLRSDNGKKVSVRFVPESSGDVARSIRIMS